MENKKANWGRPKGIPMTDEVRQKISASVRQTYLEKMGHGALRELRVPEEAYDFVRKIATEKGKFISEIAGELILAHKKEGP